MPLVDLVDDTFVAADPEDVAAVVADSRRWALWWPDLALTTTRDRGPKGRQWRVEPAPKGAYTGTAEIWLEPWRDGVLVHLFLRLEPVRPPHPDGPALWRWAARRRQARAQAWKRVVHALKDELEGCRRPGVPVASGARSAAP